MPCVTYPSSSVTSVQNGRNARVKGWVIPVILVILVVRHVHQLVVMDLETE